MTRFRSLLITAPLVGIATAVMGSISLVSSIVDSSGRMQHACARTWGRLVLSICRVKLRVTGTEHLRPDVPYVFCVNHQSQIDTPIVLAALPFPFRFAAKKELFRIPFLGWHLRRSGHIPIDRRNPRAAVKSMRDAGEILRGGASLVFFPEGGTSFDGSIKPFKAGGFMLAARAGTDLVPVTIRGSRAVWVPKTYHVRGGPVDVTLGEPTSSKECSPADLASRIRGEIVRTFENDKTLDRNSYAVSR